MSRPPVPRIWQAGIDEAEAVARLLVEFRDWHGRDWPSDNAFLASVERLMERGEAEFLLGAPHDDAPPAGVCQLRYRFGLWYAAPDCWLEDLFVTERGRGTGLGRALVEAAVQRAVERDCARIELDTGEDNAPARALYESCGFTTLMGDPPQRELFYRRVL